MSASNLRFLSSSTENVQYTSRKTMMCVSKDQKMIGNVSMMRMRE